LDRNRRLDQIGDPIQEIEDELFGEEMTRDDDDSESNEKVDDKGEQIFKVALE
jgi:hypothetical protein